MAGRQPQNIKAKKRGLSFSLRSLLIGMTVFAVVSSLFYRFYFASVLAERTLMTKVEELGGKAMKSDSFLFVVFKDVPISDDDFASLVPRLQECLSVRYLDLSGTEITDQSLEGLGALPYQIRQLTFVTNTQVSELGAKRLDLNR